MFFIQLCRVLIELTRKYLLNERLGFHQCFPATFGQAVVSEKTILEKITPQLYTNIDIYIYILFIHMCGGPYGDLHSSLDVNKCNLFSMY